MLSQFSDLVPCRFQRSYTHKLVATALGKFLPFQLYDLTLINLTGLGKLAVLVLEFLVLGPEVLNAGVSLVIRTLFQGQVSLKSFIELLVTHFRISLSFLDVGLFDALLQL